MKINKHTENLKDLYVKYLYTHHLDLSTNIILYLKKNEKTFEKDEKSLKVAVKNININNCPLFKKETRNKIQHKIPLK